MNGIICLQLFAVTFNGTVVNFIKKVLFGKERFGNRRNLKKSVPKSSHVKQEGITEAGCFIT